MIAAYKALYQFNVDKSSNQYKGPFNKVISEARLFTYKDTAIVTPNSDTPYSMVQADLRAEPVILCVPEINKKRYYSVQLTDIYTFNYGYIGSRATGNKSGCYMVAGPNWKGIKPRNVKKIFYSETQFSLIIFRTQLFGQADIENVKKIQEKYKVYPLSSFLKKPAPTSAPDINWLEFSEQAFKTDFPKYLNFLLQFCPEVPAEKELRSKFATIGIKAGNEFNFKNLSRLHKAQVALGIKNGFKKMKNNISKVGTNVNGWRIAVVAGNREFYSENFLLRATAAYKGIFANDAVEAIYPSAQFDDHGLALDGSKYNYTITFPADQLPPVNAFWSVTMYDGKTQLLIKNPIERYLINSNMLNEIKKNSDGSITIYIQNKSPDQEKISNWLPAPDGLIYLVMRLYQPKLTPQSVLPPTWSPPPIKQSRKI